MVEDKDIQLNRRFEHECDTVIGSRDNLDFKLRAIYIVNILRTVKRQNRNVLVTWSEYKLSGD